MGRLNGTLVHRLERCEQLVPVAVFQPPIDEVESFWLAVFQFAPPPLWRYFSAIDGPEGHPAVDDALRALTQRIDHPRRLAYVQGEVLKWAEWRYGWQLARDRAHGKGPCYDDKVRHDASLALLGWSGVESNANWPYPERFAERWRTFAVAKVDPDVLAAAGLHAEELELLESEDDERWS